MPESPTQLKTQKSILLDEREDHRTAEGFSEDLQSIREREHDWWDARSEFKKELRKKIPIGSWWVVEYAGKEAVAEVVDYSRPLGAVFVRFPKGKAEFRRTFFYTKFLKRLPTPNKEDL